MDEICRIDKLYDNNIKNTNKTHIHSKMNIHFWKRLPCTFTSYVFYFREKQVGHGD